jgi:hypothetical protein
MDSIIQLCLAGVRQIAEETSPSWVGQNTELNSQEWGQSTILSCPNFLGEELSCQSLSSGGMTQVLPGEIRNIFDHLRDSGSELKSE